MRKQTSYIKLWLIVGCLILTSCFATSSTTINGYVRDGWGEPVAGADVSFGGKLNESKTKTDDKGFYSVTARHRPTQILYLEISKPGVGTYTDDFPGFMAAENGKTVKLMQEIPSRKK